MQLWQRLEKGKGEVELVKHKDTRMYLRYIYRMVKQYEESVRYSTQLFKEEKMRTRLGCHAYHMRH